MSRTDDIPVVRRPAQGRLEVHIPWREGGNRKVIKRICGTLTRPQWYGDRKRWVIARAHFALLIGALKAEYGQVRVITAHCDAEGCDARCQKAEGAECVCSCGGQYHGGITPTPAAGAWWAPSRSSRPNGQKVEVDRVRVHERGRDARLDRAGGR